MATCRRLLRERRHSAGASLEWEIPFTEASSSQGCALAARSVPSGPSFKALPLPAGLLLFSRGEASEPVMSQPHPLQKRLIDEVIDREGGYVDHPADRGGPTRYGITQATARRHGYRGPMSQLPHHVAAEIYAGDYWHSLQLDVIVDLHEPLAESLFDYGIHSGPSSAGEDLQRVLNVLNRTEHDWDDLVVDGMVGPATLGAIEDLFGERGRRGLKVLTWGVESLRGAYLIGIAEDRESQEAFTFGWLDRVRLLGGRDAHG